VGEGRWSAAIRAGRSSGDTLAVDVDAVASEATAAASTPSEVAHVFALPGAYGKGWSRTLGRRSPA
jgi:hypothetical protein